MVCGAAPPGEEVKVSRSLVCVCRGSLPTDCIIRSTSAADSAAAPRPPPPPQPTPPRLRNPPRRGESDDAVGRQGAPTHTHQAPGNFHLRFR